VSIFSKLRKNFFIIIIIVMTLYVILLSYSDIAKFSKSILEIDYKIIPILLSLMSIVLLLLALRFYRLVRALDIKISFRKSVLIYFAGLSFGVTPGGVGAIIKSYIIKAEYGVPTSKTAAIIFVEKWSELNAVLVILMGTMLIESITEAQIITVAGAAFSLLFLGIVRNKRIFFLFKRILTPLKLSKYNEVIENSQNAFKILTGVKITCEGLVITTIAKVIEVFSVYLALKALNLQIDFIFSTQTYLTSVLSGVLSFMPGGFIVTEGSMLGLLVKYGTDFTLATTAVIFARSITIWFATILGLITTRFVIKYRSPSE